MAEETYTSTGTAYEGQGKGTQVAGETREWGRERGRELMREQKGKAADIIGDLADALHSSARKLEADNHPTSAHYVHQAAGSLERFSGAIRHRDIDEITYKMKDFARRQPVVVVAGTMIVGFYLARLLKSGTEKAEESPAVSAPMAETTGTSSDIPLH